MVGVKVTVLTDGGDVRGRSYSVPAAALQTLVSVADAHVATIHPDRVRGNHYHLRRDEILIVYYEDSWALHWEDGDGRDVIERQFEGVGVAVVEVDRGLAHAIANTGAR